MTPHILIRMYTHAHIYIYIYMYIYIYIYNMHTHVYPVSGPRFLWDFALLCTSCGTVTSILGLSFRVQGSGLGVFGSLWLGFNASVVLEAS